MVEICHPSEPETGLWACLHLCAFDDNWMRRSVLDTHLYLSVPLRKGNVLVAWDDKAPIGWMSYAYFDEDTRQRFCQGEVLQEEDWHSGDDFWVIDFVTKSNGREIMLAVKELLPQGMTVNWWRGKNDRFHAKEMRH